MDRDSVDRLRFDRRLQQRRDWVEDGTREAHLESLPDVTEKMTRGLDEPEDSRDDPAAGGLASATPIESSASVGSSVPETTSDSFVGGGIRGGGTELS